MENFTKINKTKGHRKKRKLSAGRIYKIGQVKNNILLFICENEEDFFFSCDIGDFLRQKFAIQTNKIRTDHLNSLNKEKIIVSIGERNKFGRDKEGKWILKSDIDTFTKISRIFIDYGDFDLISRFISSKYFDLTFNENFDLLLGRALEAGGYYIKEIKGVLLEKVNDNLYQLIKCIFRHSPTAFLTMVDSNKVNDYQSSSGMKFVDSLEINIEKFAKDVFEIKIKSNQLSLHITLLLRFLICDYISDMLKNNPRCKINYDKKYNVKRYIQQSNQDTISRLEKDSFNQLKSNRAKNDKK